jgi:hypothetical protein
VWHWINQHSFLLVGVVVLGIAIAVLRRFSRPAQIVAIVIVVALLGTFALLLRTGGGDVHSRTDVDRALAKGKPVALEFYSNF